MASPALSRRIGKIVRSPPLVEMSADQRREFREASSTPTASRIQAAILEVEQTGRS